jgi:uncharacterized damage-inducible protein DinB
MALSDVLAEYKRTIRKRTLSVLDAIPHDKLNWQPVPGVLSLGQLIRHIGQADMAWRKVLSGEWEMKRFLEIRMQMDLMETLGQIESLEAELESLEITQEELLKWVTEQSDEALEKLYDGPRRSLTAREVVLGLCEHEVHHRGQIVTYLRLLGVEEARPWGI